MKVYIVIASLFLASCSGGIDDGTNGLNGGVGPQGLPGKDGAQGVQGEAGLNGLTSLLSLTRFGDDGSICVSQAGTIVKSGLDVNHNGILDVSEVTQVSVICDGKQGIAGPVGAQGAQGIAGQNGTNGQDAPVSSLDIVKLITPCPSIVTAFREVLFRLGNGKLLASFSGDGSAMSVRLTLIIPGSYEDTDGSDCHFTVDSGNVITDQFGNTFRP